MRRVWIFTAVSLLVAGLFTGEGVAQEREIEASGLPAAMVDRLIRIVEDPATIRFEGETVIPRDSVIPGDAVVMGPLSLAGRVDGHLIVVGGDVELRPGFEVLGDLTVVDGELRGEDLGLIEGLAAQFSRSRRVAGDRIARGEGEVALPLARDREKGASSHLALRVGDYNRVEGLQLQAGPVLTTGGESPFRASALVLWRTQRNAPTGADRLGFRVEGEQFVGRGRVFRVGAGVHSRVDPIEGWGLTDRENAWSSFLFHTDHRDHFQRRGWHVFARATPRGLPVDASIEFHREDHGSLAAADPRALFGSDPWRVQPLVAEGSARSVVGRVALDTRDGRRDPADAWFIQATWRQGVGGTLAMPEVESVSGAPLEAPEIDSRSASAFLDVRRYMGVGPASRLNLRGVVGGAVDGEPLGPQYQHALGGVGSLPGHPRFAADCGAREALVTREGAPVEEGGMFPLYGCDRFALFQAEYRGSLSLRVGFGDPDPEDGARRRPYRQPRWAVFFNAGRAWANGEWGDLPRGDSPALYDAGLGLLLGDAGVYWAFPLGSEGRGSRFHVRLERRF